MDILPCPVVEAKLEVPGEKQILVDVEAVRKYAIAAPVGKFEPDDFALPVSPVLPRGVDWRVGRARERGRVGNGSGRSTVVLRKAGGRLRQALPWAGLDRTLGR